MDVLVWLTVPVGLLLIALALLDVFLTVLHIQAESPLSNVVSRRGWQLLVAASRRLPARARDEALGWGAPLMLGGIILFWAVLYIVGFTILYLPFIHDEAAFSPPESGPQSAVADAFYFSAVSFLTIGYGDIVPIHPLARLAAVAQGGLGLVTVSLAVTYLLSVFPLIAHKVGLSETLSQELGGRSDAVVLARRYVATGRYEALAQRLSGMNDELIELGQSHGLYPVLYYVRPREVHHSFVRVLAMIQGIVATLRYGLDPRAYPEVVDDPRLLILEEGLLSTLHMLAGSSHLAPEGVGPADRAAAHRQFSALTAALTRAGLAAASPDDPRQAEQHARFRAATDHYIRAYARNSAYAVDAVYASYSRWERDTALVGHAEVEDAASDTPTSAAPGASGASAAGHDDAGTATGTDVRAAS